MGVSAMTTANKITILRILLVPYFVVQLLYYVHDGNEMELFLAVLAFSVAALSDGLDGFIARRYHQQSELGTILDPLADKFLLLSGLIVLSLDNRPYLERIPLWLTAVVLSRDVILVLGLVILHYTFGRIKVVPRLVGKAATLWQMVTVIWVLLRWDAFWLYYWALGAALFTGISGIFYVRDGILYLSESPTSSARSKPNA
jgi:cardiolipin synthase (CMP-forming)